MGSRLFLSTQHALEVPLTNQYAGFPYTSDCIAQYILCLIIIFGVIDSSVEDVLHYAKINTVH